jgi:hypothetical protein
MFVVTVLISTLILCRVLKTTTVVHGQNPQSVTVKGRPIESLLSSGGLAARRARLGAPPIRAAAVINDGGGDGGPIPDYLFFLSDPGPNPAGGDGSGAPPGGMTNMFVNDPCLDPPPPSRERTVQSEAEIAVLNKVNGADWSSDNNNGQNPDGDDESSQSGKLMVAGYNDSYGFYDNRQGLSGFSYSTNGGKSWIDAAGLPPMGATDQYYGDPVVVVHHRSKTFYYASIYQNMAGVFTLSVNRGQFKVAPQQGPESKANTRCEGSPTKFGVADPPAFIRKRIIWEPPVEAVQVFDPLDFLDKEWLYVDQRTGELYLVYVRFGADGSTPLELVRSKDGGHTWIGPTIILPNLNDTFNTGLSIVTTPTGRVVVSWLAQTFLLSPPFPKIDERIETAYSDNDGVTFTAPIVVTHVNPQGEPLGYNRGRDEILNVTYLTVDQGKNDGTTPGGNNEDRDDQASRQRPGFGNVYLTYFDGKTKLPTAGAFAKAADIKLSVSTDNGATYHPPIKVNDDNTNTSHVFPSVQVNKHGTVFVTWIDRRVDPLNNILNDTWGAFSNAFQRGKNQSDGGLGSNFRITNVSTDWFVRADARPNFGDYNSSEVIDFENFVSIWSDGRFPTGTYVPPACTPAPPPGGACPPRRSATPDTLFAIVGNGSGNNQGGNSNNH